MRSSSSSPVRGGSASSLTRSIIEIAFSTLSCASRAAFRSLRNARKTPSKGPRKRSAREKSSASFPEGQLSRSGTLLRLQRGYELIARQAEAPVVPVWLDDLWGSIFSYKGGRFFTKWPRQLPYHVTVAFGAPIAAERGGHRDGPRTIIEARRDLLQPAPGLARTSRARLPAWAEARCISDRDHRWHGPHDSVARQASGSGDGARAASEEPLRGAAHRCRPAAGKRRRGRESGHCARRKNSGEFELHQRTRSDRLGSRASRAEDDHLRARGREAPGRFSLDAGGDQPR